MQPHESDVLIGILLYGLFFGGGIVLAVAMMGIAMYKSTRLKTWIMGILAAVFLLLQKGCWYVAEHPGGGWDTGFHTPPFLILFVACAIAVWFVWILRIRCNTTLKRDR